MQRKKILLFHGWNWKNYTKFCPLGTNPWHDREKFIKNLQNEGFDVVAPAFPGFCGTYEPKNSWELSDFQDLVERYFQLEKPDAVLGYSFGGAVVVGWAEKYKHFSTPLILVSPAITRNYAVESPSIFLRIVKIFPKSLVSFLRDIYLKKYVKNPFHIHGTKFLQQTYCNIIGVDLVSTLKQLNSSQTLLIYGEKDTATPPTLVQEKMRYSNFTESNFFIVPNGGHDIANSDTTLIVNKISSFLKK